MRERDYKNNRRRFSFRRILVWVLLAAMLSGIAGCGQSGLAVADVSVEDAATQTIALDVEEVTETDSETAGPDDAGALNEDGSADPDAESSGESASAASDPGAAEELSEVTLDDIPEYDSEPYVIINDNEPFFEEDEYTTEVFEEYSDQDELGRCGTAYANICQELMPTESRGDISSVHPTGWHNESYDFVDGGYVYNRCHLIAYELAAENANEENLITGTRYFNVQGMLPFENMVADYVKETDNHVLYRVTPMYDGDNLVADGVLMEAYSVEDGGDGICYCVFCYNVQPGVEIDYATGYNQSDGTMDGAGSAGSAGSGADEEKQTYVLNTNTKKFHYPYCQSVSDMKESNKKEYTGTRSEIIDMGYSPCGSCKP